MKLSIIIVNHNTRELLLACLHSVFASRTAHEFEVLVVDNASDDGSVQAVRETFADVRVIERSANDGFAAANNEAIKHAAGATVLLLNSDTVIDRDTLDVMLQHLDQHADVGALSCKVLLGDGSLDKACRRGFPTPWASLTYMLGLSRLFPTSETFNRYHLGHLDAQQTHDVDSVSGCCMMLRRAVIEQVGLLDEAYFMYGEDIDWCYRIKHVGWRIVYHPATHITHFKGGSNQGRSFRVVYEFHRAMLLFYRTHLAKRYPLVVNLLVYVGIGLRLGLAMLGNTVRRVRRR